MKLFKVITTIGKYPNAEQVLLGLKLRGVDFFRINLSHTSKDEIKGIIESLIKYDVPIIIDTEGSQIRTGIDKEIILNEGDIIKIYNHEINCTKNEIYFSPVNSINYTKVGDLIILDFNSAMVRVSDVSKLKAQKYILANVVIGGLVGIRKGIVIERELNLPVFSEKDYYTFKIAKQYGIKHFTLSFINSKKDVEKFYKIYTDGICYSKIETLQSLKI